MKNGELRDLFGSDALTVRRATQRLAKDGAIRKEGGPSAKIYQLTRSGSARVRKNGLLI